MKRTYEIVLVFHPTLNEEKMHQHIKKVHDFINTYHGNIITEDHWGNRKLAYKIKKVTTGIYHFIKCEAEPEIVSELRKYFSTVSEEIIRYSVIKVETRNVITAQKNIPVSKQILNTTEEEKSSSYTDEKNAVVE